MNFQEGDLVSYKDRYGIVIRMDGGSTYQNVVHPIFVWFSDRNYEWYDGSEFIKVDKLPCEHLERLVKFMDQWLNHQPQLFDNLRQIYLLNRLNELKHGLETYKV